MTLMKMRHADGADEARRREEKISSGCGGNYYATKIAHLGLEYTTLAFQRFYQNKNRQRQLADNLDIKPRNLARLEDFSPG